MKIRKGFVSNSSSTSFTLFGVGLDSEEQFEKLTSLDGYEYVRKTGLRMECGDPNRLGQTTYFGLVFSGEFEHSQESDMKDDETKTEFMERVKAMLPEALRDQAGWHTESFYNG